MKVDALETVVQETKRASQQLLEEQDQVHQSAQDMEAKFIQSQADLARSNASKQKMQQEHRSMKSQLDQLFQRLSDATHDLEQEREAKEQWKRQAQELQATDKLRQERLDHLEKELQESKTLLMEATAAASESQQATQKIQSSLERMEEANQQLSLKLEDTQKQLHRQEELHNHALAQAQKEHQSTQHKWNHDRDLVQSLKIEKQAADKKISTLQGKLAQAERRLMDSTNLTSSPFPPQDKQESGRNDGSTSTNQNEFNIPSLSTNNENSSALIKCSICCKQGSGVMRKCQCGNKSCAARAHATCVQRATMQNTSTSVSHPGTPAPKLPVVLCSNNGMKMVVNNRKSLASATATAVTPATSMVNRKQAEPRASF